MIPAQSPRGFVVKRHVMHETIKGYLGKRQLVTSTIVRSAENIGSRFNARFFPS